MSTDIDDILGDPIQGSPAPDVGLDREARDALLAQGIAWAREEYPFCAETWKVTPQQFRDRGGNFKTLTAVLNGYFQGRIP